MFKKMRFFWWDILERLVAPLCRFLSQFYSFILCNWHKALRDMGKSSVLLDSYRENLKKGLLDAAKEQAEAGD